MVEMINYDPIRNAILQAFDTDIVRHYDFSTDTIHISVRRHGQVVWRKIHSMSDVAQLYVPEIIFYGGSGRRFEIDECLD